jgi:hypothetical protein
VTENWVDAETAQHIADLLSNRKIYRYTHDDCRVSVFPWLVDGDIWECIYPDHCSQNATLSQTFTRETLNAWLRTQPQQDFADDLKRYRSA